MEKGLISAITPVYGTADIVHKLLDSILKQDYPKLEMFLVDDGSKDNIDEVARKYQVLFKNRGYELVYIKQENSGQSVAVNKALKLCKGEYLVWPDSDDYLVDDTIYSKMVNALSGTYSNTTTVRCLPTIISEIGDKVLYKGTYNTQNEGGGGDDIFYECLYGKPNFWFPPICYMAKMSSIDELIPNREIYTEKMAGQNWQIMLPLFWKHKCLTLQSYSAHILERYKSHSRGQYCTYEKEVEKRLTYQRTIIKTLDAIPDDLTEEIRQINANYTQLQISMAASAENRKNIRKFYTILKGIPRDKINIKYTIYFIMSYVPFSLKIFNSIRK